MQFFDLCSDCPPRFFSQMVPLEWKCFHFRCRLYWGLSNDEKIIKSKSGSSQFQKRVRLPYYLQNKLVQFFYAKSCNWGVINIENDDKYNLRGSSKRGDYLTYALDTDDSVEMTWSGSAEDDPYFSRPTNCTLTLDELFSKCLTSYPLYANNFFFKKHTLSAHSNLEI